MRDSERRPGDLCAPWVPVGLARCTKHRVGRTCFRNFDLLYKARQNRSEHHVLMKRNEHPEVSILMLRIEEVPSKTLVSQPVFVLIDGSEPQASAPTLAWLIGKSARIVAGTHTTGDFDSVASRIQESAGAPVKILDRFTDSQASHTVMEMACGGQIL